MQNYPPNNPQNPNQQNQEPVPNYNDSYIQQQLNQQLVMQQGVKLNVLSIMGEAATRLGKHFGNVFLGWLVYFLAIVISWIALAYVLNLFLFAAYTSALTSVAVSGFTFAVFVKILFLVIMIFIVSISFSMIYYFGFLSYISDLIELDSANYSNIFTGFQKIFQIIGFVGMIVIPMILLAAGLAVPFGFMSEIGSASVMPSQASNVFTFASVAIYTIILLAVFLLYLSKLVLVPNLLIAQDMTLREAVKESWTKLTGSNYLQVCLLLFVLGLISFAINFISSEYIAPALTATSTKWGVFRYTLVNALMVQVVFVFFIGCIAHTYNSLYPLELKTDPIAMASKYSRKTHPKYFQSLQQKNAKNPDTSKQQYYSVKEYNANQQQQYNPPIQQPGAEPFKSPSEQPQQQPVPKEHQSVQEAAKRYKSGIRHEEPATGESVDKPESIKENVQRNPSGISHVDYMKKDTTAMKRKSQYVSQQPPTGQDFESFIPVSEDELLPQHEKGHVSKFVDNLFEKEDYPTGKIVPVDAMRMMRDPEVKFIEVHFQNAKHAMNTLKMLPIFINVPDSVEYKIREPLSYSLTMPKIPSNPVKLFFGGKDMTIKELWDCKEIILQNNGNIVRINRGKDE